MSCHPEKSQGTWIWTHCLSICGSFQRYFHIQTQNGIGFTRSHHTHLIQIQTILKITPSSLLQMQLVYLHRNNIITVIHIKPWAHSVSHEGMILLIPICVICYIYLFKRCWVNLQWWRCNLQKIIINNNSRYYTQAVFIEVSSFYMILLLAKELWKRSLIDILDTAILKVRTKINLVWLVQHKSSLDPQIDSTALQPIAQQQFCHFKTDDCSIKRNPVLCEQQQQKSIELYDYK